MPEKKCKLTHEQCNRLEELRIGLWDNTFEIKKNSRDIKSKIEEVQTLVEGTEQDRGDMRDLDNMKNTSDFLEEKSSPPELYAPHDKEFKKPYRPFGYFNNIIHEINRNCGCNR